MQHTVNPLNSGFLTSSVISPKNILLPIKLKVENRPTQELLAVYIKKELKLFAGKKTLSLPQNSIRLMHSMKQTHIHTISVQRILFSFGFSEYIFTSS